MKKIISFILVSLLIIALAYKMLPPQWIKAIYLASHIAPTLALVWGVFSYTDAKKERPKEWHAFVAVDTDDDQANSTKSKHKIPILQVAVINDGKTALKAYSRGLEFKGDITQPPIQIFRKDININVGAIQIIKPGDAMQVEQYTLENFNSIVKKIIDDGSNNITKDHCKFRVVTTTMKKT